MVEFFDKIKDILSIRKLSLSHLSIRENLPLKVTEKTAQELSPLAMSSNPP